MPNKEYITNRTKRYEQFANRIFTIGLIFLLLFLALIVRLFFLQNINFNHYHKLSENNRIKTVPTAPIRGLIFDRNHIPLAQNIPTFELLITPNKVKNMSFLLQRIKKIISINNSEIKNFKKKMTKKKPFEKVVLKDKLTDKDIAIILANKIFLPAIEIKAKLNRYYPLQKIAVHALGYIGRINKQEAKKIDNKIYKGSTHIGKIGVEKEYEKILRGYPGSKQVEVNVDGKELRTLKEVRPTPGFAMTLTIDTRLQQVAEQAFLEHEHAGSAIVMDITNGEILTIVSAPDFNPNLFVNGISSDDFDKINKDSKRPLYNRSILGKYPPGSTIKPFVSLAGLELGIINKEKKINCHGAYQLQNDKHRYRDWKKSGHGWTNVEKSIVESCDVFYYDLGFHMGVNRMSDYLSLFGFGKKTGFDNKYELSGILPTRAWKRKNRNKKWYLGETLIMGIGQGYMSATSMQITKAVATLASFGKVVTPHLLKYYTDHKGIRHKYQDPNKNTSLPINNIDNWKLIHKSMKNVVHSPTGTARRIGYNTSYLIAGKTGTSQVYSIAQDGKYDAKKVAYELRDHALFIAFVPADNPKIAVTVIIEHGGSGSSTAAPIAKKIIEKYFELRY
ncbi:MAG: penicillin-binding protein 2 [Gammaproteobacteria bacterium]|nr:MAG: penicillin-binding protein 2 [Gammaproteobacteria bacterium]